VGKLRRVASMPCGHREEDGCLELSRTRSLPATRKELRQEVRPQSLLATTLQRIHSHRVMYNHGDDLGKIKEPENPFTFGAEQGMDPAITTATIPSGLRIYIQPNGIPTQQIRVHAVCRVGSVNELPSERGLAHFLEHLVFRGTTRFRDGEIDAFMRSIGCVPGADNNAVTTYDSTEYMFSIPWRSDSPDQGMGDTHTALEMLAEMLFQAQFDQEVFEIERRVVLEEMRLHSHSGGMAAFFQAVIPRLLAGTRYQDRRPIGLQTVVESCTVSDIERLYKRWYRPENISVLVVGDFGEDQQAWLMDRASTIFQAGSSLASTPTAPAAAVAGEPITADNVRTSPRQATRFFCDVDSEGGGGGGGGGGNSSVNGIGVYLRSFRGGEGIQQSRDWTKHGGGLDHLFWMCILQRRFKAHPSLENAVGVECDLLTVSFFTGVAMCTLEELDGGKVEILSLVEQILIEIERLKRHGVTQSERHVLSVFIENLVQTLKERQGDFDSQTLLETFKDYIIGQRHMDMPVSAASVDLELDAYMRHVQDDPECFRQLIERLKETELIVAVQQTNGTGSRGSLDERESEEGCLSVSELEALYKDIELRALDPPVEEECRAWEGIFPQPIVEEPGKVSIVVSQKGGTPEGEGETRVECSNGMVIQVFTGRQSALNITNAGENGCTGLCGMQVRLQALGGYGSLLEDQGEEKLIASRLCVTFALLSGWAGFTVSQWEDFTLQTLVLLQEAEVGKDSRNLHFQCMEASLPLLFQLLHHIFTQPIALPTEDEIIKMKNDVKKSVRLGQRSHAGSTADRISQLFLGESLLHRPLMEEDVDRCDVRLAIALFHEAFFGNPGEFTVSLVCEQLPKGIGIQGVSELCKECLASIPTPANSKQAPAPSGLVAHPWYTLGGRVGSSALVESFERRPSQLEKQTAQQASAAVTKARDGKPAAAAEEEEKELVVLEGQLDAAPGSEPCVGTGGGSAAASSPFEDASSVGGLNGGRYEVFTHGTAADCATVTILMPAYHTPARLSWDDVWQVPEGSPGKGETEEEQVTRSNLRVLTLSRCLSIIFQERLMHVLRNDAGMVYGVNVSLNYTIGDEQLAQPYWQIAAKCAFETAGLIGEVLALVLLSLDCIADYETSRQAAVMQILREEHAYKENGAVNPFSSGADKESHHRLMKQICQELQRVELSWFQCGFQNAFGYGMDIILVELPESQEGHQAKKQLEAIFAPRAAENLEDLHHAQLFLEQCGQGLTQELIQQGRAAVASGQPQAEVEAALQYAIPMQFGAFLITGLGKLRADRTRGRLARWAEEGYGDAGLVPALMALSKGLEASTEALGLNQNQEEDGVGRAAPPAAEEPTEALAGAMAETFGDTMVGEAGLSGFPTVSTNEQAHAWEAAMENPLTTVAIAAVAVLLIKLAFLN